MSLGITEGITDADRDVVREFLTTAGLSVQLSTDPDRELTLRNFAGSHLEADHPIIAATSLVLHTAVEPISTYNALAELLGVAG